MIRTNFLRSLPLVFALSYATCHGEISVPGDASSIQAGLDLAIAGETVFVGAGTYLEQVVVPAGVSLVGPSGADATVIDGTGLTGAGIWVAPGSGTSRVEGLTVRGHDGVGIFVENGARADIAACRVEDVLHGVVFNADGSLTLSRVQNVSRIGVQIYRGGLPASADPLIAENQIIGAGWVGINVSHQSFPVVENNTVVGCGLSSPYGKGSGIYSDDTGAAIRSNIVAFNHAGGMFVVGPSHFPVLSCNDTYGNSGGDYEGASPGSGSISVDPLFCDVQSLDFSLRAGSPCAPGNHPEAAACGLIGALGVACSGSTATEVSTWTSLKQMFR